MNETKIIALKDGPLGWIVINRPEQHNALSEEMWRDLAQTVSDLAADNDLRVIIITGGKKVSERGEGREGHDKGQEKPSNDCELNEDEPNGGKSNGGGASRPDFLGSSSAFISGADIGELQRQAAMTEPQVDFTIATLQAITRAPLPVIAMINGHCYGGGVLVALACDLRFASETARFAIPAAKIGAAYPVIEGIERLVKTVGATAASDLLLSGRTINAREALRIGLVNGVQGHEQLEAETARYALALADGAPLTLRAHKIAIQNLLRPQAERDAATALQAMMDCYRSRDFAEGIAAFLAKRQPKFNGE